MRVLREPDKNGSSARKSERMRAHRDRIRATLWQFSATLYGQPRHIYVRRFILPKLRLSERRWATRCNRASFTRCNSTERLSLVNFEWNILQISLSISANGFSLTKLLSLSVSWFDINANERTSVILTNIVLLLDAIVVAVLGEPNLSFLWQQNGKICLIVQFDEGRILNLSSRKAWRTSLKDSSEFPHLW